MTDSKPNLILIGLRASGKSTLGKVLANRLGLAFVDLDDVVSALLKTDGAGQAIQTHGIDAFRNAEAQALSSVLEHKKQIIALGGGSPTAPGCAEMLAADPCTVVYLRALPATLRDRLRGTDNTNRPALVGDDVIDEVQMLFDQRDELYCSLAETVIQTDDLIFEAALAELVEAVETVD